jgi:hypothetical protein
MLSNVTTKYNSLQMQFVTLMQQRRSVLAAPIHQQEVIKKKEQIIIITMQDSRSLMAAMLKIAHVV